jgi:hypothetical protein
MMTNFAIPVRQFIERPRERGIYRLPVACVVGSKRAALFRGQRHALLKLIPTGTILRFKIFLLHASHPIIALFISGDRLKS